MGVEDDHKKAEPPIELVPVEVAEVEGVGIDSEVRTFSGKLAAEHGLPGLVEDDRAQTLRDEIVRADRAGNLNVAVVGQYADHLMDHFAQVEDLKPKFQMAVAQVVHSLLMIALRCERGRFNDAYTDLYDDRVGSIYALLKYMETGYPEVNFQSALDSVRDLSGRIPEEPKKDSTDLDPDILSA